MKRMILSTMGLFLLSGCQNFRYHDSSKAHRGKNQFLNNYNNEPLPSVLKWQWERLISSKTPEPEYKPEVINTDVSFLRKNNSENTLTWIGHASSLVQIAGVNVLLDPVFSERASPLSFIGPKRLVRIPFTISDLPKIDVVLISHCHYDHLDLASLRELASRPGNATLFLVPLGDAQLLQEQGINNVKELDWWDEQSVKNIKFTFVPAQHWTARGPWDRNQTLWGGWHFSSEVEKLRILFTGDTGYSQDFKDIQARLGDVDLALIPVGAYEPRWFMRNQHVNPEESVQIHRDVRAKLSIGVHWGTFRLTDEPMLTPLEDLTKAIAKSPLPAGTDFRVLKHGETIKLK